MRTTSTAASGMRPSRNMPTPRISSSSLLQNAEDTGASLGPDLDLSRLRSSSSIMADLSTAMISKGITGIGNTTKLEEAEQDRVLRDRLQISLCRH